MENVGTGVRQSQNQRYAYETHTPALLSSAHASREHTSERDVTCGWEGRRRADWTSDYRKLIQSGRVCKVLLALRNSDDMLRDRYDQLHSLPSLPLKITRALCIYMAI